MDWAVRKVLSWWLSNTLDASFCVEVLEQAIAKYDKPQIMNTDQGSQYTGTDWITTLTSAEIKISMDGRRHYLDNILIERLWRHLKQEAVYLLRFRTAFKQSGSLMTGSAFTTPNALTPRSTSARQIRHTSNKRKNEKRHEHKIDASEI